MINFSHKFTWNGPAVLGRIKREVQVAVRKSAEQVRTVTKAEALNTSGASRTNKGGLNRGSVAKRIWRKDLISDLRTIKIKGQSVPLMFGGNFTYRDKAKQKDVRLDRIYWYGEPVFRWVQSSVPGTPPHKQSRNLQKSIAVQTIQDGMRAKIGPAQGLKYARIQELGGKSKFGTLPPRPYLKPSFDKCIPFTLQEFRKAVARATTK